MVVLMLVFSLVISVDLRQQEAYCQIFDALEYLNSVCDDVFKRISVRVSNEKSRIQHVNARLSVAQVLIVLRFLV